MPRNASLGELIEDYLKDEVIDMHNPKCRNCNDCCSISTMLSEEEFRNILKYVTTNPKGKRAFQNGINTIREYKQQGTIYFMCPFSNKNRRCEIYFIRPAICREFHCSPELNKADRQQYEKTHTRTIFDLFKHYI